MKNKRPIRYIVFGLGVFSVLLLFFVASVYFIIYREVTGTCAKAMKQYQKDCIDSLVLVLGAEDKSIKQKNDAIWALGQIADERALPALTKLQTENMPDKEPLDKVISQYEIKKAIHWIEDGNWTSWMYVKF